MKKSVLLVIETSRGFGRGIIEGISRYATEQGDWSLLFQDRGMLDKPQQWLKKWKGDGIIARSSTPEIGRFLHGLKIPIVELLGDEKEIFCDFVLDNVSIGRMAMEHLAERNFKHFAYFSPERWWWSIERRNGFQKAVVDFGGECLVFPVPHSRSQSQVYSTPNIWEIVGPHVFRWLEKLPKPIGLFVVSDLHAIYIVEACKQIGISIPEEIAVLGMDNDYLFCHTCTPQLSSIDPNTPLMGYEAAKRLDRLWAGKPRGVMKTLIPPAYVATRQTTDIVAMNDPLIARILNYIRENVVSIPSVRHLAEEFCMTQRTMERRFKATV